mgnify:CR=1 FL=1
MLLDREAFFYCRNGLPAIYGYGTIICVSLRNERVTRDYGLGIRKTLIKSDNDSISVSLGLEYEKTAHFKLPRGF